MPSINCRWNLVWKKSILKILGENDKNIKLRKIWGVVLVLFWTWTFTRMSVSYAWLRQSWYESTYTYTSTQCCCNQAGSWPVAQKKTRHHITAFLTYFSNYNYTALSVKKNFIIKTWSGNNIWCSRYVPLCWFWKV